MSKAVEVYDKKGRSVRVRSMAETARIMGIGLNTLKRRISDGNWIIRDGYVPVKVSLF